MSGSTTTVEHEISGRHHRTRWWALATVSVAISITMINGVALNIALPTMIGELRIAAADAEWVNSAYALIFAAALLPAGRVGDLVGHRRLLAAGVLVFVAASLGAGLAGGPGVLILARLGQGAGAAMILPATLATLHALFPGRERATAFGIWGAVVGGTVAIGPILGGWLTTAYDWRWIFFLNVPLGLAVLAGVWYLLPAGLRQPRTGRFDVAGAVTFAAGFGALVFVLIEDRRMFLPLAAVCLAAFVAIQRARYRRGGPMLVDPGLFRLAGFRIGTIAVLLVELGEFGMLFVLPLYLQGALGYTALESGLMLLALALGALSVGPFTGPLVRRFGLRAVVATGLLSEAAAIAGLAGVTGSAPDAWLIASMLFSYGAGIGMASAQLSNAILAGVPADRAGQAAGAQSTVRMLGSALGVAVLGTVLLTSLTNALGDRLDALPGTDRQTREAVAVSVPESLGTVIPQLQAEPATAAVGAAAADALVDATRTTSYAAAAVLFLGFLVSLRLPRRRPEDARSAPPPAK